jgi:Mg-chelatase subunit ChlD
MPASQQDKLADKVKDKIDKQNKAKANNPQPLPQPGAIPEPGQSQGQGQIPGQSQGGSDEPGDGAGDTPGGSSAGAPGASGVTELLKKTMDDIVSSKQKEIHKMRAQVNGFLELDGKTVKTPERAPWATTRPVNSSSAVASRSFARELEELRAQYDPAWINKVDQGRLNVQRYVTGGELDEAFDQWDMGREDAVDIECVILLDNSGSMHQHANQAYEAMWAIKRALDKVDASTTVVTFSDDARLLYSSNEHAQSTVFKSNDTEGGTEPFKAVNYAQSVLANSNRAIKILIPITDGEWYGAKNTEDIIRRLRSAGVITALGMIGYRKPEPGAEIAINTHGCEVGVNIDEMSNLFTLARAMVRLGIERNLA